MNLFTILLLINFICLFGKQITIPLNILNGRLTSKHVNVRHAPFTKQKTHQKKQTFLSQLKKQQKHNQKQQQNRTIMRKKYKNKK